MKSIKFLAVAVLGFVPLLAQAEDSYACEVALCLANPQGSMAVSECVPPIRKLHRELARGKPFPKCDMNSGDSRGNSIDNRQLDGKNCPAQHRVYVGRIALCKYQGVINVKLDNKPHTRVYWSEGESYTEDLSSSPPADDSPGDDEVVLPGQQRR